eukprot:288324_1
MKRSMEEGDIESTDDEAYVYRACIYHDSRWRLDLVDTKEMACIKANKESYEGMTDFTGTSMIDDDPLICAQNGDPKRWLSLAVMLGSDSIEILIILWNLDCMLLYRCMLFVCVVFCLCLMHGYTLVHYLKAKFI